MAAGASIALQEGVRQATQDSRSAEESAIITDTSALLGSLLGRDIWLLTRSEYETAAAASLHSLVTAQPGSVGAAQSQAKYDVWVPPQACPRWRTRCQSKTT